MDKKLVIVGSDSFCDPNYPAYQKYNISPWAERFAVKCDYDLLNVSKGGCSNRYIVNSIIDAIMDNLDREIIVIAGWTESYRLSFADDCEIDNSVFLISDKEHQLRCDLSPGLYNFFTKRNILRKELIKFTSHIDNINSKLVIQSFKNIWLLYDFCKTRNIPFFHVHCQDIMANDYSLSHESYDDIIEPIMKNKYVQLILESENYIGHDYCLYNDIEKRDLFIDNNLHPNQKGADYIADMMYDFIVNGIKPEANINSKIYRIKK